MMSTGAVLRSLPFQNVQIVSRWFIFCSLEEGVHSGSAPPCSHGSFQPVLVLASLPLPTTRKENSIRTERQKPKISSSLDNRGSQYEDIYVEWSTWTSNDKEPAHRIVAMLPQHSFMCPLLSHIALLLRRGLVPGCKSPESIVQLIKRTPAMQLIL